MNLLTAKIKSESDFENKKQKLLKGIFWSSIVFISALAIMNLTGWITGIDWIKSIIPGWTSMRGLTAVCFLLTSAALSSIFLNRPSNILRALPVAAGILLIFLGAAIAVFWVYLKNIGQEIPVAGNTTFSTLVSPSFRMSFLGSIIFLFIGTIILLLANGRLNTANIAHLICLMISFACYSIPVSYLLGLNALQEIFGTLPAPATGLSFCFVSLAIFTLRPDTWFLKVITSKNFGGIIARRMIPWLIFLPVILGFLRVSGEKSGLYSSDTGIFLLDIIYSFCFVLLLWFTARSINRMDSIRETAVGALKKAYSTMEEKVKERTSELMELNTVLDKEVNEKRVAEKLVNSERGRMNNLLEMMPAYIILLTPDHKVAYSNRTFRENFGASNGKKCFEFLFNRTEPCEICETYKVLRDNKPVRWEWEGPNKHIYSIHDFPYTDSDGSPLIMEMGIDITDLKKAEASLVALNVDLEQKVLDRTAELRNLNERLYLLSETSGLLLASENPQELINSLCLRVMKYLDCQVFFNYLSNEPIGKLHLNSYFGISTEEAEKISWLEIGMSICGLVAKEGKRIIAENISFTNDPGTALVKSFGIKAYACHPLLSHDSVIGTLSFGTRSRTTFSSEDLSLMKAIADQVAIALTRVRDKESLTKSEERYRSLMELSPGACFVCREDNIVLINSAAMDLLGAGSTDEVLGKTPFDVFHPSSHTSIRERLKAIKQGKSTLMSTELIIRKDGALRDVEVVSAVTVDPDGPAIQFIINDITERMRAEKELFETKNYLENLTDKANAPIIVWDQENRIRLFNHAFERLTGYSATDVEGKKLDLLFPKDSVKESMRMIKNAITKNWETIEIPILTRDERIRTVLWNSAKVYDNNRKTFSTIAQGNDITERIHAEKALKESKEKLDIALENGQIGTWEYDTSTQRFSTDAWMGRMFGLSPGTFDYSYDSLEKRIHEEDIPHFRLAFKTAINYGSPIETVYRIRHPNGDINFINTKALVEKSDGETIRISGVCFDITAMKKGAEKALFSLNEELLRSNRELEQFAYVASHDLQEPLRMISSFTQLLSQRYGDKLDQNAHEFIQYAVEGAARMQILINDLLDYSRINTRTKKYVLIDMHDILGQAVKDLKLKIQEKNALVTNDELPKIIADEGQMVQLFQNLIGNGLKFCKNTPRIHISAREENECYIFSVKDNGIGIERQYFEKIFQIFQRLHPKDQYGGTGIGLAICKRIVENHGGRIWVESGPGKGSVFFFTILKN